jgi:CRP-like cAMP-binding protein
MDETARLRRNAILASLPEDEFTRLRSLLHVTSLELGEQAYQPGGPMPEVYFPITAVFSMIGLADGRPVVEVGTTGREGMLGLPVFLGRGTSPHASFCQIPGYAARLAAGELRDFLSSDGGLHRSLNEFTQATIVQIAQNVVCNSTHPVGARAARWLLTTQDRVAADQFPLTQEFLSQMLGVRRPTVSEAARNLSAKDLIRYQRGIMTILDRPGLEQASCNCYAIVKAEFDALTRHLPDDQPEAGP